MDPYSSLQGVNELIGGQVRNASRARNYSYLIPFNFGPIAAGAQSTITQKLTAAGAFIAFGATGVLHDGTGVDVTNRMIDVSFAGNDGQWQLSQVPWFCAIGTALQPFYWLFRPTIAPGTNIQVTIFNRTAATAITGTVMLAGHVLDAGY